ncbi:MAG: TATA-box-binding protein [Candidatus Altiarchaeota archaeon]|nr:TATA-box-binding protein [Candidatus Altiarchaeota archaeon]
MAMNVKVENMVSAITLNLKIDLKKLVEITTGLEYNPDRFPGVVYRIREPKLAMLIFSSGKVICTGARSKEDIKRAVEHLLEKLKEGGIEVKEKPSIEIQNIVASSKVDFKVNLDLLAMESENTEYEPEQFPGLVFRLAEPKTVMLVFRSGKMIITGAKTAEAAQKAAEETCRIIKEIGAII